LLSLWFNFIFHLLILMDERCHFSYKCHFLIDYCTCSRVFLILLLHLLLVVVLPQSDLNYLYFFWLLVVPCSCILIVTSFSFQEDLDWTKCVMFVEAEVCSYQFRLLFFILLDYFLGSTSLTYASTKWFWV
jgi:hypothetical protein